MPTHDPRRESRGAQGDPAPHATPGWIHDHFKSRDGANIFYRFYPVSGARHTVIMLHGFGEHSGRYEKYPAKMERLSAQFAIMDMRGMGKSEGSRGDIGAFEEYLEDLTVFVAHLRKKHGIPAKFILLGHSLGGLIALHWAMKNPVAVKLLVLSAPFLGFRSCCFVGPANRILRMFLPRFSYKNPVRSRMLSHDPAEVEAHRKDPLVLRAISSRLVGEIMRNTESLKKQPILSLSFPVHMLFPGFERVVDPKASARFFDRLVAPRKERSFFEGFYHEIFNEREQQKAFNVLKTIIEDCV